MKIILASDHAGFKLKEKIKNHLEKKHDILDFGTNNAQQVDYPDYITPAAKKIAKTKKSLGIILGGSGQGEAIAANKIKGIRAVVLYDYNTKIIKLAKEHNNANVLSLGARFLSTTEAIKAVDLWIKTKFSSETRHKRRLKKIKECEK